MVLSQLLYLDVCVKQSVLLCLPACVCVCKDTFETIRIRAKPWNLVVYVPLDTELVDEPSLTGTVFYMYV